MELFILISVSVLIVAYFLFREANRPKQTCPNGHVEQVRQIKREPLNFEYFESFGGGGSGGGYARSRVHFAMTYRCNKCGETWTVKEIE